jgi:streptogramin lyase
MRALSACVLVLTAALALLGAAIADAGPFPLRSIIRAEMPVRPNGLAIDDEGRIWLTLQGSPPSLGLVRARACSVRGDCEPEEFELPDADATPRFVAVSPRDDTVWVTATVPDGGRVYHFDPETETFETYETAGGQPYDVAVDSHGVVWFTDLEQGTINSIRAGSVREEYRMPEGSFSSPGVGALGIAVDPDDAVWCACGTDLVRLSVGALHVDVLVRPIPGAVKPHGVFAQDGNRIWVLDQHANRLFRYDRGSDAFDDWQVPALVEDDVEIIVDPHWLVVRGATVYFTGFAGVVGTFDTRREVFGGYVVSPGREAAGGATGAYDIALERSGRIWLTEVLEPYALSRLAIARLAPPRRIPPPIPDF